MPRLSGMEITRRAANITPTPVSIILSIYADEAHVWRHSKWSGGYALKRRRTRRLDPRLHEVAAGRRYLSPPLSERAIEAYAKRAAGK